MGAAQPNGDDYGTYRDQLLAQEQRAREVIKKAVIPQAQSRSVGASASVTMSHPPAIPYVNPDLAGMKTDGVAHIDIEGTTITMPIKAELSYDPSDHRWHVTVLPKQTKVNPAEWQTPARPADPPTIPRDKDGRQYRSRATKPRTRRRLP